MTTQAAHTPATPVQFTRSQPEARLGFGHLVRSQWIALSSLRGTLVALILGVGLTVGGAAAFTVMISFSNQWSDGAVPLPDLTTMGVNTAIIAICVAVLVAVSHYAKEHTTGAHRTILAAAPRRVALIGAKAAVIGLSTFVATIVTLALSFTAVAVVFGFFGNPAMTGSFLDTVAMPILGGSVYAAACAVFALAIAVLLRSETWSVLLVLMFLLFLPTVLMMLPYDWAPVVHDLLLGVTGNGLMLPYDGLSATLLADLGLTLAWPAAALAVAMLAERSRDA